MDEGGECEISEWADERVRAVIEPLYHSRLDRFFWTNKTLCVRRPHESGCISRGVYDSFNTV